MRPRLLLIGILLFLLPACGTTPPTDLPAPVFVTVTPNVNATPTLTPFLPAEFTEQTFPTLEASPNDTATPPPAAPLPAQSGQVSILLLGSDQRPGRGDFRTDVFLLVTIRGDGSVSLVSFPRDLYVYLPGLRMERINTAYEFGGFDMVAQTMEYNFGVRPDHFVLTNFSGFESIVDSLGGVDVNVGLTLSDARPGYPGQFTVSPGLVHMDGETALWYVRSRATSSDFDRLRRAQEVLEAIGQKLLTLQGLARVPELYQIYKSSVVTDLTLDNLLGLLPLLKAVDPNRIDRYAIAPPLVMVWVKPDTGAYLLVPDAVAIRQVLQQAMGIAP